VRETLFDRSLAPVTVCFFMTDHSCAVSFAGFNRTSSGIPILPTS
jgi:hypothetical protein